MRKFTPAFAASFQVAFPVSFLVTFVVTFLVTSLAFQGFALAVGGDIVGNGADIVYCTDPKRGELLDLHEGAYRYGYEIAAIGTDVMPVQARATAAFERLKRMAPEGAVRTSWIDDRIERFMSEVRWIEIDGGKQDDDRGKVEWSPGCTRERLVMRFSTPTSDGIRYAIEEPRWRHLDSASQAATIVHEVLYGYAHEVLGHTDSERTRRLNALLHSRDIERMSWPEFYALGEELGFCRSQTCF